MRCASGRRAACRWPHSPTSTPPPGTSAPGQAQGSHGHARQNLAAADGGGRSTPASSRSSTFCICEACSRPTPRARSRRRASPPPPRPLPPAPVLAGRWTKRASNPSKRSSIISSLFPRVAPAVGFCRRAFRTDLHTGGVLDTTTGEVVDVIPLTGPVSELGSGNLLHGASYRSVG